MIVQNMNERITRLLRDADPLSDDPGLSRAERAAMRRKILAEAPSTKSVRWPQLAPALSAATLLAVALGVAWWPTAVDDSSRPLPLGERSSDSEAPLTSTSGSDSGGDPLDKRQIQFETPGGTLVVWVLDPEFSS